MIALLLGIGAGMVMYAAGVFAANAGWPFLAEFFVVSLFWIAFWTLISVRDYCERSS